MLISTNNAVVKSEATAISKVKVREMKVKDSFRYYVSGATTVFALQADQRFSYAMYVPAQAQTAEEGLPLVVIQHGTGRSSGQYRDLMAEFCERHGVVALAPLFPAGIEDPNDLHNYKFLEYRGIRFDELLLSMIEEVAERVPIDTEKFMLHGFSGGGQFAQRFLFVHPQRLSAVSIGAPGRLTMIDNTQDWWLGVRDFETRFGRSLDIDAIRRVPIQLLVGELDVETWETLDRSSSNWVDGLEKQGANRRERLENFRLNLADHDIDSQIDIMPGEAHNGRAAIPFANEFFARHL